MTKNGGKGNEPFWKSRRCWAAALAGVTAFLIQLGYIDIASTVTALAGGVLGVTSWVKPK